MRVGILASHPIQYQAPWFRALATRVDLEVFFGHQPTPDEQAIGFGTAFQWDIDLLSGYSHRFLRSRASRPSTSHFFGVDTPEIASEIDDGAFDAFIVSGWNLKSYWQAVRACRRARVPILVRGDSQLALDGSHVKHALKKLVYPEMLRQFTGFLSVGSRNREYLRHYGVREERIHFVPHFVDNRWFEDRARDAAPKRLELRARWGVDDEANVALFVGKFVPKKRPKDLLEGVAFARRMGKNVVAAFVGAGELESTLRKAATDLHVPTHFEGFKNQTELPMYYAAGDVIVLPSDRRETWGLVVNEAMAGGCPAVVSDAVGCGPDLIDRGETGFTFPVRDVQALGERLATIADLRNGRFDFRTPLSRKVRSYSLDRATDATIEAVATVVAAYSR